MNPLEKLQDKIEDEDILNSNDNEALALALEVVKVVFANIKATDDLNSIDIKTWLVLQRRADELYKLLEMDKS